MRRPARSKRAVTIVLFLRADYPDLRRRKTFTQEISVSGLLIICAVSLGLWQTSAADFAISIPI